MAPEADPGELTVRPGDPADLPAVAELYLRTREAAYPAMPHGVHPPDEVRAYVAGWDLSRRELWVAEQAAALVGYAVVEDDWLDSLYVAPEAAGRGIGSVLLEVVKQRRPGGFGLWVFESNESARRFYRRHGLVETERTDGSANEEGAPDIRVEWAGTRPL
ncbi:GNAT family N-acetyltransferase [Nocardioides ferulae]|uniref:GNAT family N-acetyltransferase n=1 Tax=Nocardioides ferulae TaxID=2340821 RepID=UPI000EB34CA3|nr:GNAT family N-acetyltransferase [Nocardioides ferulae]